MLILEIPHYSLQRALSAQQSQNPHFLKYPLTPLRFLLYTSFRAPCKPQRANPTHLREAIHKSQGALLTHLRGVYLHTTERPPSTSQRALPSMSNVLPTHLRELTTHLKFPSINNSLSLFYPPKTAINTHLRESSLITPGGPATHRGAL